MYVGVLKHLSKETVKFLFQNTPLESFPLGERIEFVFQWSQWINTFDPSNSAQDQNIATAGQITSSNSVALPSTSSHEIVPSNEPIIQSTSINLSNVLKSNPYGESVLRKYNKENKLDENARKLLAEAVLHYCIGANHELSTNDAAELASQIEEAFPGEIRVQNIYFLRDFYFFFMSNVPSFNLCAIHRCRNNVIYMHFFIHTFFCVGCVLSTAQKSNSSRFVVQQISQLEARFETEIECLAC